jgi:hypothetical protein
MSGPTIRKNATREHCQERLYKALDYDPNLTPTQIAERFRMTRGSARIIKTKWQEARR